ncbi:hypothetical protein H0H93_011604 [Arthromyces matolae]|nr:hypothetical protein H0H93_011604 [Arthromyces matolae]
MPLNFIRLTKFLLTALVASQTLHFSLTKAAPTPDVTSDTSMISTRDAVVVDSESAHFPTFDSLSIHGGVACRQCESDPISVLNRRKEPEGPDDIRAAFIVFEKISKKEPVDDETLSNTLVNNLSDLQLLTGDPSTSLSGGQLIYTANQYRWAYYLYLERRFRNRNPMSLTQALKVVILFSKEIQNIDRTIGGPSQLEVSYRDAYLKMLHLLRIKPDGLVQENSYVNSVVERFIQVINLGNNTSRKSQGLKEIRKLTRSQPKTADNEAVAHTYILLYGKFT